MQLKAVLFGLKLWCKEHRDANIRLRSDNMMTISCTDCSGSAKDHC